MTLKYLIQKEFMQIRRNSFLPRLIIVFPIMIMCVMPWVASMEVKNIVVDVVDQDRSQQSAQLVSSIRASNYFIFHGLRTGYKEALADIEHTRADAVVVIPQDYSKDLTMGRTPQVLIAANAVNGTKGSMGSAYLSQIVTANAMPCAAAIRQKMSILFLYNKNQNYKLFMIPALLAMLLALFFSAFGLIISNYSDNMQQAVFVMWFFVVCIMLLSGLFTPTRSMPQWAYMTTYVNPMHYFIDGVRTVFIRGGSFLHIWHQTAALLVIGLFMATWAVESYKKNS